MNNYYQRLDLSFPEYSVEDLKGELATSYIFSENGKGIFYYKIKNATVENEIRRICEGVGAANPYILYAEITNSRLWLHRDVGGTVAINHYIETPPTKTIFFTTKPGYNGQYIESRDATLYEKEFCIEQGSFIAEPKSTWMLNVSEIHTIEKQSEGLRRMLSIGFPQQNFESLSQRIKYLYD